MPENSQGQRRPIGAGDARSRAVWAYIDGVAGDGATARSNAAAWQRYSIRPRVLRDVTVVDPRVTVLGRTLPSPIIVAPWAGQAHADPHGELATARAASSCGATLCLSSGSSYPVETVAAISGPYIQQLYLPTNRDIVAPFLRRVVAAGAFAIVVTVDNPTTGTRPSFRAGLAPYTPLRSVNFPSVRDRRTLAAATDVTARDITWLREFTGLPILVKGVLRGDDAAHAIDAGAAGVIVSNHGGRQLDGTIATADALTDIVDTVRGTATVVVDGGIRTGTDIVRALALGADAVAVGRPLARALAAGGETAVHNVLTNLLADFDTALALTGTPTVPELTRDLLSPSPLTRSR
ncbi:alpha-hydroxy acid oxidase [Rhodococcus erythropolis]|uniref:alpha-hydroxy acid oxidase n=1 Tax=Rhodococcus erythropolis TaxID=1833 RepID=UPI002949C989|nr:alpha-hydroxy acid oxidase [Rhodococcus erythropolis]MDV6278066.1 alpha-hydroxy acid oxidase [Rhodococcus erythropolis]